MHSCKLGEGAGVSRQCSHRHRIQYRDLMQETKKERELGSNSVRLWGKSKKVLARIMENTHKSSKSWLGKFLLPQGGTYTYALTVVSHQLGAAQGKHGFSVNTLVDPKQWQLWLDQLLPPQQEFQAVCYHGPHTSYSLSSTPRSVLAQASAPAVPSMWSPLALTPPELLHTGDASGCTQFPCLGRCSSTLVQVLPHMFCIPLSWPFFLFLSTYYYLTITYFIV